MSRNNAGIYSTPPGTTVQPNTTVQSAPYNTAMLDIAQDLNNPRPVSAGGTGVTTAAAARTVLGAISIEDVDAMFRGMVIAFPFTTPPDGWLVCNGQAVSRTTYADLFALLSTTYGAGNGTTTFNLPDMRGYFVRGLDLDRDIDPDRVLGSTQDDDLKAHTHTGTAAVAGAHAHAYNVLSIVAGATFGSGSSWGVAGTTDTTASSGSHTHAVTVSSTGGSESRPKNIAMVFCIKF